MTQDSSSRGIPRPRDAAQWFTHFASEVELQESDYSEWIEWAESEENLTAYDRLVNLHQEIVRLPPPPCATDDELLNSPFATQVRPVVVKEKAARRAHHWAKLALAACLVTVAFVGALHLRWTGDGEFHTAVGEQGKIILPDGSTVTLGGNTLIKVHYGLWHRTIALLRGEGMFSVAHEAARPFTVCATVACTTAVGTIFDVRVYATRVNVWVQQGTVSVSPRGPSHHDSPISTPSSLYVMRGQNVSYDTNGRATITSLSNTRLQAAWTTGGELTYHSQPLSEVVEDIQRYSERPLYVDPAVGQFYYSGSVLQRYVEDWIRGLATVYPVRIVDCQTSGHTGNSALTDRDRVLCSHVSGRVLIQRR